MVGIKKPIAAPTAYAATARVMAVTLSFAANQVAASLAGTLLKNGCPIAQNIWPITQM
mgnify:CR=1 FL=1